MGRIYLENGKNFALHVQSSTYWRDFEDFCSPEADLLRGGECLRSIMKGRASGVQGFHPLTHLSLIHIQMCIRDRYYILPTHCLSSCFYIQLSHLNPLTFRKFSFLMLAFYFPACFHTQQRTTHHFIEFHKRPAGYIILQSSVTGFTDYLKLV